MKTLKEIVYAIKSGDIEYGINKEYCFVTDEDGRLVFLKRNLNNKHQHYLDLYKEIRNQWPENCYDGEIIWETPTYEQRGLIITELFLESLNIDFLG